MPAQAVRGVIAGLAGVLLIRRGWRPGSRQVPRQIGPCQLVELGALVAICCPSDLGYPHPTVLELSR